jgi:phage tail-like protein
MDLTTLWQISSVEAYGDTSASATFAEDCAVKVDSFAYPSGFTFTDARQQTYEITSPSIVVTFGLPADIGQFTLDGRVRILLSKTEFRRDAEVLNTTLDVMYDLDLTLPTQERDALIYKAAIPCVENEMVYVSLAYYDTTTRRWLFDPVNLMSYVYVRPLMGTYGEYLFNLMPAYQRKVDVDYDNALERILTLLGSSFDDLIPLIRGLQDSYNPKTVPIGFLPYIDRLIGWSTNFELKESLRRQETQQAVSLWKAKGTRRALELAMQNTVRWDAEIHEGHKRIFVTNTSEPQQPADWIEGEVDPDSLLAPDEQASGIWDQMLPSYIATWSPELGTNYRDPSSKVMVLPAKNDWLQRNGLLIELKPLRGARNTLTSVVLKKAQNILPLFLPHYVDVFFLARIYHQEALSFSFSDAYEDDLFETGSNVTSLDLDLQDEFIETVAVGVSLFSTYDVPTELNNVSYRLFHSGVSYAP